MPLNGERMEGRGRERLTWPDELLVGGSAERKTSESCRREGGGTDTRTERRRDGQRLAAAALGMQWQVAPWIVHTHTGTQRKTHTQPQCV